MKFKTAFDRGKGTLSPLGSPKTPIYEYKIDEKTGRKKKVLTGYTNLYEMIQASHESTKLINIIQSATSGDITALLQRGDGQFVDISEAPTSLIELQNLQLKAETEFAQLPADIRKKFENNVKLYIAQYGTEEWGIKLGLIKEILNDKPEEKIEEVTKDE